MTTEYMQDLKLRSENTLYGYNISLVDHDDQLQGMIATKLDHDPLASMTGDLDQGYWFRAPEVTLDQLGDALDSLEYVNTVHNLTVKRVVQTGCFTAYARFQDRSDAAMFAFNQLEVFQKWSNAQQQELEQAMSSRSLEVEFDSDGITRNVTITVETLED